MVDLCDPRRSDESRFRAALLNKEQEVYYFRKMNYLKFRASRLRDEVDKNRPRSKDLQRIEDLLDKCAEVRNVLIRRNLISCEK